MSQKLQAKSDIDVDGEAQSSDRIEDDFERLNARSIPRYLDWQSLICRISSYFMMTDCFGYDIGTDTGALIRRIGGFRSQRAKCNFQAQFFTRVTCPFYGFVLCECKCLIQPFILP